MKDVRDDGEEGSPINDVGDDGEEGSPMKDVGDDGVGVPNNNVWNNGDEGFSLLCK